MHGWPTGGSVLMLARPTEAGQISMPIHMKSPSLDVGPGERHQIDARRVARLVLRHISNTLIRCSTPHLCFVRHVYRKPRSAPDRRTQREWTRKIRLEILGHLFAPTKLPIHSHRGSVCSHSASTAHSMSLIYHRSRNKYHHRSYH